MAFEIVEGGHNLLVTGQAGTGRSYFVSDVQWFRAQGRKVEIICASGIAGTVYSGSLRTSTVHTLYRLKIARLLFEICPRKSCVKQFGGR